MNIHDIMSGGFLRNYKTYIAGLALIITGLGQYASGDLTLIAFIHQLPVIAGGLGLIGLRNALAQYMPVADTVADMLDEMAATHDDLTKTVTQAKTATQSLAAQAGAAAARQAQN